MTLMRKAAVVSAAVLTTMLTMLLSASAEAAEGAGGGCAAFGANVSGLAIELGGDFGATASSVATSGPGAFPTLIVHPEQAAACP